MNHNRLPTEPVEVTVTSPDGALPGAPIISTTKLTTEEKWDPKPGQATVGDAFSRTITIKATDVPGMLLPELTHQAVEGLEMYRKQPRIQDSIERGGLMGERIETMTYVRSKPGDYEIPGLVIRWWDVNQKSWKDSRFPSVALRVSPNPAFADKSPLGEPSELSTSEKGNRLTLFVLVGTLLAGLFLALPWLRKTVSARRTRWLHSEAGLFTQLVRACRQGNAPDADRTLTLWLDAQGLSREQLHGISSMDNLLKSELRRLQEALIGHERPWNGRKLAESLRHIRDKRNRTWPRSGIGGPLPPLNPVAHSRRSVR